MPDESSDDPGTPPPQSRGPRVEARLRHRRPIHLTWRARRRQSLARGAARRRRRGKGGAGRAAGAQRRRMGDDGARRSARRRRARAAEHAAATAGARGPAAGCRRRPTSWSHRRSAGAPTSTISTPRVPGAVAIDRGGNADIPTCRSFATCGRSTTCPGAAVDARSSPRSKASSGPPTTWPSCSPRVAAAPPRARSTRTAVRCMPWRRASTPAASVPTTASTSRCRSSGRAGFCSGLLSTSRCRGDDGDRGGARAVDDARAAASASG